MIRRGNRRITVSGDKPLHPWDCVLKLNIQGIPFCHNQFRTGMKGIVHFPGLNGLGADRAIFLADDTGPVHGPGQAAAPVHKSGADFDGALIGKRRSAQPFIQAERSDGRRGAKIATGNAIELAAAGSHAKIQNRVSTSLRVPPSSPPDESHWWDRPACTDRI